MSLFTDDLEEARRVFERREPARRDKRPARAPRCAADRRHSAGGADDPADCEGAELAAAIRAVHETILLVRLTTLGDLLLDVIVRLNAPLVHGDDQTAATRTGAGGQAANVAAWARALGADARFVGKRGDDTAGELVSRELRAHGVDVAGPVGGRTGVVVSLASDGDRTMASDRGAAVSLTVDDLDPGWFECDALHISGYSLLVAPLADATVHAAALARDRGALVSIDVSTWTLVDDAFRARVATIAPDVLFATEPEREALGDSGALWVLKRGPKGVAVDGVEYEAVATEVVDTTGAGDALAAGYLIGGPALGLEAAASCCARMGAMP